LLERILKERHWEVLQVSLKKYEKLGILRLERTGAFERLRAPMYHAKSGTDLSPTRGIQKIFDFGMPSSLASLNLKSGTTHGERSS
jgi:hypothetical protein